MKGCDHCVGGARIGAALKAAGYVGVIRYAAAGRADVNITWSEVADLRAHGVSLAIVNEHSAGYLLGGYDTGYNTALGARQVCREAGLDDGVIFMAGDSETLQANIRNQALVADALRGAGDAIGRPNVGFYGSYYMIQYLLRSTPWVRYWWQCAAWSGGLQGDGSGRPRLIHPAACALQRAVFDHVGGVELDPDDLLKADWGQRDYKPTAQEGGMITFFVNSSQHDEYGIASADEVVHRWTEDDQTWHPTWESLGHPGSAANPIIGISSGVNRNGHDQYCVVLRDGTMKDLWKLEDGTWNKRADGGFNWDVKRSPQ